jgi:hypothetical protein
MTPPIEVPTSSYPPISPFQTESAELAAAFALCPWTTLAKRRAMSTGVARPSGPDLVRFHGDEGWMPAVAGERRMAVEEEDEDGEGVRRWRGAELRVFFFVEDVEVREEEELAGDEAEMLYVPTRGKSCDQISGKEEDEEGVRDDLRAVGE